MGKGGEQNLTAKMAATSSTKKFALDHMPTEELRKWAKAYGVKEDVEREVLLAELVGPTSILHTHSLAFSLFSLTTVSMFHRKDLPMA